jgi:hypothetical protein
MTERRVSCEECRETTAFKAAVLNIIREECVPRDLYDREVQGMDTKFAALFGWIRAGVILAVGNLCMFAAGLLWIVLRGA